jgi:hypothetical protein
MSIKLTYEILQRGVLQLHKKTGTHILEQHELRRHLAAADFGLPGCTPLRLRPEERMQVYRQPDSARRPRIFGETLATFLAFTAASPKHEAQWGEVCWVAGRSGDHSRAIFVPWLPARFGGAQGDYSSVAHSSRAGLVLLSVAAGDPWLYLLSSGSCCPRRTISETRLREAAQAKWLDSRS